MHPGLWISGIDQDVDVLPLVLDVFRTNFLGNLIIILEVPLSLVLVVGVVVATAWCGSAVNHYHLKAVLVVTEGERVLEHHLGVFAEDFVFDGGVRAVALNF